MIDPVCFEVILVKVQKEYSVETDSKSIVSITSSAAPAAFCVRVMVSDKVPAVTVIVAVLSEASVFFDTATSTVLPLGVPTAKSALLDVAVQLSTLVSTVMVTVSPAAEIPVSLLAVALR